MDDLLDLSASKLTLEGTKKEQQAFNRKFGKIIRELEPDKNERIQIYKKRKDFYTGNQGDYSNIVGIIKDGKQKRGHTNQVANYAGKTVVKMAMGLANNPPRINVISEDVNDNAEEVRAQATEDFTDSVLNSKKNRFWKKTYRRAAFHQAEFGDAAIKVYPDVEKKEICIVGHDDMSTIMVAWNGNPGEFDAVVVEYELTAQSVFDKYGVRVNEKMLKTIHKDDFNKSGSWLNNNQWGTKGNGSNGTDGLPTGKTLVPKVKVQEYDSEDVYAIRIQGELIQFQIKDDITYPRIKYWTIIPNIPNPPSPWSIADIDYLMDVQVELNDNDNRSADHLRVGNVQRYVAYNMNDFDPESIKTTSGQVIFVNDPEGKSKFEPLQTNINNFPDDQYHNRKLNQMFDMGLPKVTYGSSGADSGRSKALDYQSSIDLTEFKRDAWELALQEICEKIQVFGNFLHPDVDWFQNTAGQFVVRNVEFDWTDILPVSQSDKIVNVANKFNMIGISLKQAYKELGYRNPEAMIEELRKELDDDKLMILRAKAWTLSQGLLEAQANATVMAQSNASGEMGPGAGVNEASPTLTPEQNSGNARPMASKGGTTSYSSAMGAVAQANQNRNARG